MLDVMSIYLKKVTIAPGLPYRANSKALSIEDMRVILPGEMFFQRPLNPPTGYLMAQVSQHGNLVEDSR